MGKGVLGLGLCSKAHPAGKCCSRQVEVPWDSSQSCSRFVAVLWDSSQSSKAHPDGKGISREVLKLGINWNLGKEKKGGFGAGKRLIRGQKSKEFGAGSLLVLLGWDNASQRRKTGKILGVLWEFSTWICSSLIPSRLRSMEFSLPEFLSPRWENQQNSNRMGPKKKSGNCWK